MFENNRKGYQALSQWLDSQRVKELHACLEATGRYGEGVAGYLHEQGYVVSLVNPSRIHAYGQSKLRRSKNEPFGSYAPLQISVRHSNQSRGHRHRGRNERYKSSSRESTTLKEDRQRKRNKLRSGSLNANQTVAGTPNPSSSTRKSNDLSKRQHKSLTMTHSCTRILSY